jgi:PAS domain-containing protein
MQEKISYLVPPNSVSKFRELALKLSEIGNANGVVIRPFKLSALPLFSKLSPAHQQSAVDQLSLYVAICEDVMASAGSLASSRTFVWRAFSALGFVPDSNLFNLIGDDDVVEIYNMENIQIFRNLRFFEFCSYTLEELFSKPWMELFVREDPEITKQLINLLVTLAETKNPRPVSTNVGPHFTREVGSESCFRVELEVKHVTVLFSDDGSPEAYVACERAKFA